MLVTLPAAGRGENAATYKHFNPGQKGKTKAKMGRHGRKYCGESSQTANCRAGVDFREAEGPEIR